MKLFLSILLSLSLCFSQSIEINIPGERKPTNGGGSGGSIGLVIGALIGLGLSLLLTKFVFGKDTAKMGKSEQDRVPFLAGQFIVVYEGEVDLSLLGEVKEVVSIEDGPSFALISSEMSMKEFSQKANTIPNILFWQPNYIYEIFEDPLRERQPYLSTTGQCSGKEFKVAIIDTGADLEHEDLRGAFLKVENMLSSPYKPEEHGTAVASLIGARRNGVGMEGVAYESQMVLLRACEEKRCYSFSVSKALSLLLKEEVKVINMSFGIYGEDRLVELLLERLSKKGVLMTAPVGNRPGPMPFPAKSPYVISVAGMPCHPKDLCQKAEAKEPYENLLVATVKGYGVRSGVSFASALHAGRLLCKMSSR